MDEQRRIVCVELERLANESKKQFESSASKREREDLLKQRDSALREAHLWRSGLAKARERVVILEAAIVRAEERAKVAEADAGSKIKEAMEKELASVKDREELLAYVNALQAQAKSYDQSLASKPGFALRF
ncbi:hypothetical protein IFM89_039860 [Coptis chinensis]|uniref:Uncharacterized protein n=1 Tax=Coptis chinensis TaxID=261450 RepID=A0A835L9H1_9MAGN|nr:hypothetical protein IFM89_039860 [Coptis chinensis]